LEKKKELGEKRRIMHDFIWHIREGGRGVCAIPHGGGKFSFHHLFSKGEKRGGG